MEPPEISRETDEKIWEEFIKRGGRPGDAKEEAEKILKGEDSDIVLKGGVEK